MIALTVRRDILKPGRQRLALPDGQTLAEMAAGVEGLPASFWQGFGVITVAGHEIAREYWHRVRPKAPVTVALYVAYGKGGASMQIFAQIALLAATTAVSFIPVVGPIAAAALGFGGQILLNSLFAPAKPKRKDPREPVNAGISGNTAEPLAILARVAGKMRVAPNYLAWPYTTLVGEDVYAQAIIGLAGNHLIENVWLNGTDVDQNEGVVDYETREGTGAEADLTLVSQTVVEERPGLTLANFHLQTNSSHAERLYDQVTPDASASKWHSFKMRGEGDEAVFRLLWGAGIENNDSDPNVQSMAVRTQFRVVGTGPWTNGPEFHFSERKKLAQEYRQTLRFLWNAGPTTSPGYDNDRLATQAYWQASPGMAWEYSADAYFQDPAGSLWADHVEIVDEGFNVYLDPGAFPRGEYEFRMKRGLAFKTGKFSANGHNYTFNGSPVEAMFFDYHLVGGFYIVEQKQHQKSSACQVEAFQTIDYAYPLPAQTEVPMTLVAIQIKNGSINSLSAEFTSRCNVWNGSDWSTLAPTQNPAALFRHFRIDDITAEPLAPSLLDTASIETWYDYCAAQGYECGYLAAGPLNEVLDQIATAGWSIPRESGMVGVITEKDRSGESPVQVFTPLNSSGLTVEKTFGEIPDAIYAEYNDELHDYTRKHRTVYGDGFDATSAVNFQSISYESITDPEQVSARARMDWRQTFYRQQRYSLEIGAEHLVSQRGDLVAVAHDVLDATAAYGIVDQVLTSGAFVTGLRLEATAELSAIGGAAGVALRYEDGTCLTKAINETTDTSKVTFTTPFAAPAGGVLAPGCLVAFGPLSTEYRRMIIQSIRRSGDLRAQLVLVDEAVEIHGAGSASLATVYSLDFSKPGNSQYLGFF